MAAGLKIANPSAANDTAGYSPALLFLATQCELGLGIWLLFGRARITAWLFAVLFFAILTGLSLRAVLAGQSDCGCFGSIKVNPWWTASFNISALTLLATAYPKGIFRDNRPQYITAGLLAFGIGSSALLADGPMGERWLANWRGEHLVLSPAVVEAGQNIVGTKTQLRTTVRNHSDQDVKLIGGSVSCNCTTTRNLPLTVPAHGSVEIEIDLDFKGTPGQFTHRFELLTDHRKQPKLHGTITGTVLESVP